MQPKQIPQAKSKAKPKSKAVAVAKPQPLVAPQLPVVPDSEKRRVLTKEVLPAINKAYGAGTIMWLEDVPELPRVTTGIMHLDDILQGGMEVGGIVIVYGKEKSGKTALALQIAGQEDNGVVYIDGENKMSYRAARRFGVHGDFAIARPKTIEAAYEIARDSLKAGMKLIIIDSLTSLTPSKELQEKHFDKTAAIAPIAGLNSKKLSVLNDLCYEHQATLLIVNQLRANMNMRNPFGDPYRQPGGYQLLSMSKLMIRCAASTFIKVEERVGGKKVQHEIGLTFRYQVVSSSYCPPRGTGEIPLLFASGFQQEIPDGVVLESIDGEVEDVTVEEVIETLHGGQ